MGECRGNTFEALARALNDGETKFLLTQPQMAQLVEVHNAVVEAKNELVRENARLLQALAGYRDGK